mgnify:CR=1 FL=1
MLLDNLDAAVATAFALAVTHPAAGNIGGGGFMVMRLDGNRVYTIDYRETAPARATRDMYLDDKGEPTDRSVYGHLAPGVPGAVAGMLRLSKEVENAVIVAIICDRGDRYLSTGIFN